VLDAARGEAAAGGGIDLFVAAIAIDVVVHLFDHRDAEHKRERRDVGEEEADLEHRHKLRHGNGEKEEIEEELELIPQHQRHKRHHAVFLIPQHVGCKQPRAGARRVALGRERNHTRIVNRSTQHKIAHTRPHAS
jgi:hypothetical protein